MTICASVKVQDGIVLGTDSMTQIVSRGTLGETLVQKAYANARKLFQIDHLPIGVMSWGAGNLGPRTVESLVLEYGRDRVPGSLVVNDVATALLGFLEPLYNAQFGGLPDDEKPVMGFFLGGYSPDQPLAEECQFQFPDAGVMRVREPTTFGASWRGIDRPFSRLFFGHDPEMERILRDGGVPDKYVDALFSSERWGFAVIFDGMPIQDAVHFAEYILRTTIGATEFQVGAPSCGGPLQIAAIGPDLGFRWVTYPEVKLRGG